MAEIKIPYIKVTKNGPYLVFGKPKIAEETIVTDKDGISVSYAEGKTFEIKNDPVALCRCGHTQNAPFCDGAHAKINFNGTETAGFDPVAKGAKTYKGPNVTLQDAQKYCAFARFCDTEGQVWHLVKKKDAESTQKAIDAACKCPAGRLVILDKNGKEIEENHPMSITVLEDPGLKISGPLYVKGGIRVESADGKSYEIRNRQTLCRCGASNSKPFCNGAHASIKFKAQKKQ